MGSLYDLYTPLVAKNIAARASTEGRPGRSRSSETILVCALPVRAVTRSPIAGVVSGGVRRVSSNSMLALEAGQIITTLGARMPACRSASPVLLG